MIPSGRFCEPAVIAFAVHVGVEVVDEIVIVLRGPLLSVSLPSLGGPSPRWPVDAVGGARKLDDFGAGRVNSSVSLGMPVRLDSGQGVDAAVTESVAGSFEGDDVGVVDDPVDHGCGDRLWPAAAPTWVCCLRPNRPRTESLTLRKKPTIRLWMGCLEQPSSRPSPARP